VQDPTAPAMTTGGAKSFMPFGQPERARIFTNLITVHCELKDFDKAKKIMSRAISEFQGTPEEVRVMLA
jgi:pentatricopeptide repeat protein